jgi:hypothetical protein
VCAEGACEEFMVLHSRAGPAAVLPLHVAIWALLDLIGCKSWAASNPLTRLPRLPACLAFVPAASAVNGVHAMNAALLLM